MSIRRDASTSVAAVLALLPGFVFPFVAAWSLGPASSDRLLLAVSVAITVTGVIGSAVEANTVSEVGRAIAAGTAPGRIALIRYRTRVLRFAVVLTVLAGSLLLGLYALSAPHPSAFLALATPVLFVPLFGALASVRSGELIAYGRVGPAIWLQSLRMLAPLIVVLVWRSAPLSAVVAGYVAGELIRCLALSALTARMERPDDVTPLGTRGLVWQSASSMTAQGGPVTDRVFLAGAPTGSLSAYEMADKLFFAATQFLNLGFLVRRLAGWSGLAVRPAAEGRALLTRDLRALGLVCAVAVPLLAGGALVCARLLPIPQVWGQGFTWAAIVSVSLPLLLTGVAGGRLLIIARKQHLLIRLSASAVTANALLDWLFFVWWGPIGIPIATVGVRAVSAVLYVVVLRSVLPGFLGSELAVKKEAMSSR